MRIARILVLIVAMALLIPEVVLANAGGVSIGIPKASGVYKLIIDYLDKDGKEMSFECEYDSPGPDETAAQKYANLLIACQLKLLNDGVANKSIKIAAGPLGSSTIIISSRKGAKRALKNIRGEDKSKQVNTYTGKKQSTKDKHKAIFSVAAATGPAGDGTLTMSILGETASVSPSMGQSISSIVSDLGTQLDVAGVPNVTSGSDFVEVDDIPDEEEFEVENTDSGITITAGIDMLTFNPIPALSPWSLGMLVMFMLGLLSWSSGRRKM